MIHIMHLAKFLALNMHWKVLAIIMGKIYTHQLYNSYSYLFRKCKKESSVTCLAGEW